MLVASLDSKSIVCSILDKFFSTSKCEAVYIYIQWNAKVMENETKRRVILDINFGVEADFYSGWSSPLSSIPSETPQHEKLTTNHLSDGYISEASCSLALNSTSLSTFSSDIFIYSIFKRLLIYMCIGIIQINSTQKFLFFNLELIYFSQNSWFHSLKLLWNNQNLKWIPLLLNKDICRIWIYKTNPSIWLDYWMGSIL